MKNVLFIFLLGLIIGLSSKDTMAAQEGTISVTATSSNGENTAPLFDKNFYGRMTFKPGDSLTITSSEIMYGIYLEWHFVPSEYEVKYNDKITKGGSNSFLHEYLEFPEGTREVVLTFSEECHLADIYGYGEGEIPASVQRWEPMLDKADMLVLTTHADDEVLFLGGALVEYAGERKLDVQVIYFFDYTPTWKVREHEKLNGLWEMGVRNYPDCGGYKEQSVNGLDHTMQIYEYPKALGWVVERIRKYKPQICVTQDVKGEYGQPHHQMVVKMMMDAVNITADETQYTDSVELHGTHDVAKTYLHLWKENAIKLDTRKPLESFGGRTAYEVCCEAYKKHESQQEFWFYVSDDNEYSMADYGLYRTTVGIDTGNDMMENIISYKRQEEIRLEEESKEAASREEAEKRTEEATTETVSESETDTETESTSLKQEEEGSNKKTQTAIIILVTITVCAIILIIIWFCVGSR